MQASQRCATTGPSRSAAASALATKLAQVRQAPFARPEVPDVNSTASVALVSTPAPASGIVPRVAGSWSNRGTTSARKAGTCAARSARRASPALPSSQPTFASTSCCASSRVVSRRLSGRTVRPASAMAWNHAANSASPSSSRPIGASTSGAIACAYSAPRRAQSSRSAKVQMPARVSSAGASGVCAARHGRS